MVDWSWILFPAVLHASSANLPESPDYNTVLKMLKDVSEIATFSTNSLCLPFTFLCALIVYIYYECIDVFLIVLCYVCTCM